ncbi:MAG: ferritin family protein [Candidatus Altiarchaeota archaeon]
MEEISKILKKALELEVNGYEFYNKCSELTDSKEAKKMFSFLAKEEQRHYEKIEEIYMENFKGDYFTYERNLLSETRNANFEKIFSLENLKEKADVIDALNLGIKAEKDSIELYNNLSESFEDKNLKELFEKLAGEEKKHLIILEDEKEFITDTGAFKDFRVVTM